MSRLNNTVKFIVININILFFAISLIVFGFSLYLLFADWGNLDPGFFLGIGLILALFSLSLALTSCLGCQGINNQINKYGFWTGRKIIGIFEFLVAACCVGMLYLLSVLFGVVANFKDTRTILEENPDSNPPYTAFEAELADKFNNFFFGSASSCSRFLYQWFWDWVNDHCPENLNQNSCQGCEAYSITFCQADEQTCYANPNEDGPTCPYTICREGMVNYFIDNLQPWTIFVLVFAIFLIIFVFLNLMLFCYHPRDTLEQILYKSGTINQVRPENNDHSR